jgi:hypothetical protein
VALACLLVVPDAVPVTVSVRVRPRLALLDTTTFSVAVPGGVTEFPEL